MLLFIFTSSRELLRIASAKWHLAPGDDHPDSPPMMERAGTRQVSGRLSLTVRPARVRYGASDPAYHH